MPLVSHLRMKEPSKHPVLLDLVKSFLGKIASFGKLCQEDIPTCT